MLFNILRFKVFEFLNNLIKFMKLAQAQTQYAQFIDLSPDPKKPDAIELKSNSHNSH